MSRSPSEAWVEAGALRLSWCGAGEAALEGSRDGGTEGGPPVGEALESWELDEVIDILLEL
jgi:hypothetical protein